MEFQPLKKIGEPVSFKGLRGAFLINSLIHLGTSLLTIFLVNMLPLDGSMQLIITGIILILFMNGLSRNRKRSKGDLNLELKKKCRKRLCIKK